MPKETPTPLFAILEFIADFNPDLLIVLSADHVYKLDFRDVIETHLNKKASVTMVTTRLPKNESASRFGVVETDKNGRITKFEYKPDQPKNDLITAEVFVYDAKILIETLKKLTAKKNRSKITDTNSLPHFVKSGRAFEHRHTGYWRDVGTIESFWRAHMELLDEKTKFVLDDKVWQILTLAEQRVPAFIYSSADIKNSLISLGCKIKGSVEHSVLSANVLIETGAAVRDSVVLPNAVIEAGVKLEKTIVDSGVKVTKERIKKIEEIKREDKNAIMVVGKYKVQSSSEIED
ncbi:MAG: sugar phosphate nucleotidyltransferase [Pyrinomonadaceae bacterium]